MIIKFILFVMSLSTIIQPPFRVTTKAELQTYFSTFIESSKIFCDENECWYQKKNGIIRLVTNDKIIINANTISNEVITLATIPVVAAQFFMIENRIKCTYFISYSSYGAIYRRNVSVKNTLLGASIMGASNVVPDVKDAGITTALIQEVASGNNILIQAKGQTGIPLTWSGTIDIFLNT